MNSKWMIKDVTNKILFCILMVLIVIAVIVVIKDKSNNKKTEDTLSSIEQTSIQQNTSGSSTQNDELQSDGIFANNYQKAEDLMKTMTIEEKVGQMFLVEFSENEVEQEIKDEAPGGYILTSDNFKNETKETFLKKANEYQESSKINLVLAVNEEGGGEVAISGYKAFRSTKFQSSQSLWAVGQIGAVLNDSREKSSLLKSIGLNMNLCPVADVPTNTTDFIYARSYGRGVDKTQVYVSELIKTMNESGMISTLKHFPGYGNNSEIKTTIPVDKREYSSFESSDFLPFKSGIEAGAPTILVSNIIYESMDDKNPASLSENIHKKLRKDLGFSGIIIADDVGLELLKAYAEDGKVATKAVLAGNDIIISSNFKEQKQEVVNAVKNKKISEQTINKAVKRILAWKYQYEIIK